MDSTSSSFDIIDFGSASSDGTPLIQSKPFTTSYTAAPNVPVPIDRLRKFEEFIEGPTGNSSAKEEQPAKYWSLQYFLPYFNVTTATVLGRLLKALKPFSASDFFDDSQPDLYAPFWISTTLIVLLTVSGNTANYLNLRSFTVDLSLLVSCTTLVYSMAVAVPVAAYCLLKQAGEVTLIGLVSIYGYSLVAFLPAVVVAGLEVGWLQWPIMGAAAFWSFTLLRQNYQSLIETHCPDRKSLLLLLLAASYGLFILTVNLKFLALEGDLDAQIGEERSQEGGS